MAVSDDDVVMGMARQPIGDTGAGGERSASRLLRLRRGAGLLVAAGLDLVLPRPCPGCGGPEPWCPACAATLEATPRAIMATAAVMDRCAHVGKPLPACFALSRYAGPVRGAIVAGKERGRRDLPPLLGAALGRGVVALQNRGVLPLDLWLVPAPTRRSAARARGGDPVLTMARFAAVELARAGREAGVAPCLYLSRRVRDSVGLDPAARARNLAGSIAFDLKGAPPDGAPVVVLDDVFTTGATALGAVETLASRRFEVVAVLVVAAASRLRPKTAGPGRTGG